MQRGSWDERSGKKGGGEDPQNSIRELCYNYRLLQSVAHRLQCRVLAGL